MKLSIYCDGPELLECLPEASENLALWLDQAPEHFQGIYEEQRLGLYLSVKKNTHLKEPLNFLYQLAQQYKLEFVVCQQDEASQNWEEVCYFGHEEGKPDLYEVACYLGL